MRARWQPSSGCRPKKSLGSSAGCKAGGSSIVHDRMEIASAEDTGRVSGRVPLCNLAAHTMAAAGIAERREDRPHRLTHAAAARLLALTPCATGPRVLLSRGTQGQRLCRRTARRFCGAPGLRAAR